MGFVQSPQRWLLLSVLVVTSAGPGTALADAPPSTESSEESLTPAQRRRILREATRELRRAERLYERQGRTAEAQRLGEEVLAMRQRVLPPGDPAIAEVQADLAFVAYILGELEVARTYLDEALGTYDEAVAPDDPQRLLALLFSALVAVAEGDSRLALEATDEIIAHRGKTADTDTTWGARVVRAGALGASGRRDAASEAYETLLELAPRHGERRIVTLTNYGMLLFELGEYARAEELLEQAIVEGEWWYRPDVPELTTLWSNAGMVHAELGDHERARHLFEEALRVHRAWPTSDPAGRAIVHNNLGLLLWDAGDWDGTRRHWEEALAVLDSELGESPDLRLLLANNLGTLELDAGRTEAARELLLEGLTIAEATERPAWTATLLGNLGHLHLVVGDLPAAGEAYQRALDIRREHLGPDHPDLAFAMSGLGEVAAVQGDYEAAAALQREALDHWLTQMGTHHPQVPSARVSLARTLLAARDPIGAHAQLRTAVEESEAWLIPLLDVLSTRERLALLGHHGRATRAWLGVADAPAEVVQGWEALLRWKGLGARMESLLRTDGSRDPQVRSLRRVRQDLARAVYSELPTEARAARIGALTEEKERLERAQGDASPQLHQREVRAEDVCARLESGEALVDYAEILVPSPTVPLEWARHYVAYVVRGGTCAIERVELGPAASVDLAVRSWRTVLVAGVSTSWIDRRGAAVRALVFDPLRPSLGDASRIQVVPDGALTGVSFAALPAKDGGYLVASHTFSTLDSGLDLLRDEGTSKADPSSALVVGDVDFGPPSGEVGETCTYQQFAPLPGAAAESRRVAELLRSHLTGPVEELAADQATEARVAHSAGEFPIVHFATHGFFANEACREVLGHDPTRGALAALGLDPMTLSGLALTGANTRGDEAADDGIWTAAEVAGVPLDDVELVVLSGCDTGLGEVRVAQGVLGLRRAFAVAGVPSVAMSLWAVDDEATALLMERFYEGLLVREETPAQALAAAQRSLIGEISDRDGEARPELWGGFVVTGR